MRRCGLERLSSNAPSKCLQRTKERGKEGSESEGGKVRRGGGERGVR